ncbi:bifunctional aspartate kinase/homoserine dehydrogenase I [Fodinibius salsisoli]|uniref:Bifunctional aspartate kinase/homoserine dehydrogenase I n=1 Tax=Fodinibius salsisoli TaxID=2820877 RepID=A0ABT3PSU5_9BACT|nr:bifunctional aspartate kinase/homoserine dehydrogenase I [Fodinibius salsisoli]MCW9708911.1 bifunctional aspartate kinase/homoserine dehydrogenase I [Fodinibius salsisoli]
MRILKFGGSSVGSEEAIKQVIQIISRKLENDRIHVVVSAFGGVTHLLEEMVEEAYAGEEAYRTKLKEVEERHIEVVRKLIKVKQQSHVLTQLKVLFNELEDVLHGVSLTRELTERTRDFVLGFGERFSAFILSHALQSEGIEAEYIDARELITTDNRFGNARVRTSDTYAAIQNKLGALDSVAIITGFIASTETGETTTLGRGGSDYTASLIAAALKAEAIEIWTDVTGIMTADPRKVSDHLPIKELSYEEAMELSHFGANVIYPPTIHPAMADSIPIYIKNTFEPDAAGTIISKDGKKDSTNVQGISSIDEVTLITLEGSGMVGVSGFAARIFSVLADAGVNIIMITQASSEHTVCFAVLPHQANRAMDALNDNFSREIAEGIIDEIIAEKDCSVVAVVGEGMKRTPGISGRLFRSLGRNGINVRAIAQGSSERNISVVVKEKDLSKTLNTIHDAFFLSKLKSVNLFLIGIGLIGSKLLELFEKQTELLFEKHNIKLKLCGIANSRHFKINAEGMPFTGWPDHLEENAKPMSLDQFLKEADQLNLPNSLFIDCTASQEVSDFYPEVMKANFSLVTANKKANSGSLKRYEELQELALEHNVMYLYETNVGAGLPVVKTLKEQVLAGDTITKIEGVLSGTLSYIFNTYDGATPFSEVVRTALEKGYTEPDPREDLNGRDVARKLIILAREAGIEIEMDDLSVENLVPEPAMQANSIDQFFDELAQFDDEFKKRYDQAASRGNKLCYIASYQDGKANVGLQEIGGQHPFNGLSGSDNIFAFHTKHYQDTPLVVKGPGAGAEVTASGILADILRISNVPAFSNEIV